MSPRIIGIGGYSGTGKDTVARILGDRYGFERVSFADALRDDLYILNPWIHLGDGKFDRLRHVVDTLGWDTAKRTYPEIREIQQVYGTDVGRNRFGQDVWVDRTSSGLERNGRYVFPDVRFHNEAKVIRRAGGYLVRIHRPGVGAVNDHVSDNLFDTLPWDYEINNEGDLDDLGHRVDVMLTRLSIRQLGKAAARVR